MYKYLVTGGAGFIGSSVIRNLLIHGDCEVLNIDDLTYAGNLENLLSVEANKNYHFRKVNIIDSEKTEKIIKEFQPDNILANFRMGH